MIPPPPIPIWGKRKKSCICSNLQCSFPNLDMVIFLAHVLSIAFLTGKALRCWRRQTLMIPAKRNSFSDFVFVHQCVLAWRLLLILCSQLMQHQHLILQGWELVNFGGVVALSSLAMILGESLTIHSRPALFFVCVPKWRLARTH